MKNTKYTYMEELINDTECFQEYFEKKTKEFKDSWEDGKKLSRISPMHIEFGNSPATYFLNIPADSAVTNKAIQNGLQAFIDTLKGYIEE